MKLGDFPLVETLVDVRSRLVDMRDKGRISLEIDGRVMGADFIRAVAPAINAELQARVEEVDQKLTDLGVAIG